MPLSIRELWTYPVKSCGGIKLEKTVASPIGFPLDRHWVVVKESGRFLTQRQEPRLALVRPRVEPEGILSGEVDESAVPDARLILSIEGHEDLEVPLAPSVPRDTIPVSVWAWSGEAWDEGDRAGRWLSEAVGTPGLRLARYRGRGVGGDGGGGQAEGAVGVHAPPRTAAVEPHPLHVGGDASRRSVERGWSPPGSEVTFSDQFPYLVVTEASLRAVSDGIAARAARLRVGGTTAEGPAPGTRDVGESLPMNRFRPNVVVAGAEAWAEDDWGEISTGGARLQLLKPCPRCKVTTVNQASGSPDPSRDPEPLATLAELRKGHALGFVEPRDHRQGVFFGWHAVSRPVEGAASPNTISAGDAVDVLVSRPGAFLGPQFGDPAALLEAARKEAEARARRPGATSRAPRGARGGVFQTWGGLSRVQVILLFWLLCASGAALAYLVALRVGHVPQRVGPPVPPRAAERAPSLAQL